MLNSVFTGGGASVATIVRELDLITIHPNKENFQMAASKRGRSAVTGRFVKQPTVKRSPKTTINESTKKRKKK